MNPGSRLWRAAQAVRLRGTPLYTRWELLYLSFGKRLLPPKDYRVHLKGGQVYFAAESLTSDQRAFDEIFLERCYPADYQDTVVVDVGAHKGYYGAYALLHGALAVLSYEPEQRNFAFLQRSAESFGSHGSQWHIYKAAVGSHEGEVDLHVSNESWSHTLLALPNTGQRAIERVPLVPMNYILEEASSFAGGRLLVKVDAEGAECDIVLGISSDCWRTAHEVFFETHAFAPCSPTEAVSHLQAAGLAQQVGTIGEIVHMKRTTAR